MKLNVRKIKKEMRRLNWSYAKLARESGLESRQSVFYYLKSGSIKGAEIFGRALDIDPKDLLITNRDNN